MKTFICNICHWCCTCMHFGHTVTVSRKHTPTNLLKQHCYYPLCDIVWFYTCSHRKSALSHTNLSLHYTLHALSISANLGPTNTSSCCISNVTIEYVFLHLLYSNASYSNLPSLPLICLLPPPPGLQGYLPGALHARRGQRDRLPAGGLQQAHGHQADAALEQAGPEGVPGVRQPTEGKHRRAATPQHPSTAAPQQRSSLRP